MKKFLFVCLGCIAALASSAQETPFVDGDLIVMFAPAGTPQSLLEKTKVVNGISTKMEMVQPLSKGAGIYLFHFDPTTFDQYELLRRVQEIPEVLAAQFNHLVEMRAVPTDPQFGSQWHHIDPSDNDIDSDLAWNTTTGGNTGDGHNIVAAITESGGINWAHADLIANHWTNSHEVNNNGIDDDGNGRIDDFDGWNSTGNNDNIPSAAHGTACMGMMGATANNGNGGAGVCWNTDLMAVSFTGGATEANVIACYDYPYDMRVQYNNTGGALGAFVTVTSSSWGIDNANPASFPVWCAFYNTMGAAGILSVCATTNNNVNVDVVGDMPTGCSSGYMISVTATNSNDVRTFSGFGPVRVDLGAPGESVWIPNLAGYSFQSGTSFATPCVAGAVALMYSLPCANFGADGIASPGATALLIRDAIFNGVDVVADLVGDVATNGRLNVNNSLNLLIAQCGPAPGCFDVDMTDSFGDGWNGAVYNIYNSIGTLVASGSLANVGSGSNSHCLGDGCFTFEVTGGTFPSEVGWTLVGVNGGPLSGGANTTISFNMGTVVIGCTNSTAANYNAAANCDDGSCVFCSPATGYCDASGYSEPGGDCATSVCSYDSFCCDTFWDSICASEAANDSNCTYCLTPIGIFGCNHPAAANYDPAASCDDGSCLFCAPASGYCDASGYSEPGGACANSVCSYDSFCCTTFWDSICASEAASDGNCAYCLTPIGIFGCTHSAAANYNPSAVCDDGSCVFCTAGQFGYCDGTDYTDLGGPCAASVCASDSFCCNVFWDSICANSAAVNPSCGYCATPIGTFACTDPNACNFDFTANCEDGSCVYCPNFCLAITMTDAFGDNWNGASYLVYDAFGNLVANGTMDGADGSLDVNPICLDAGCYTMEVTGGSFPSEVGWTLNGANEGAFSGGANVAISFTVGNIINGCLNFFACNYNPLANCDEGSCVFCLNNCLSIDMTDSYGDGWNSAVYNVYDAFGNLVTSGTMDNGFSTSDVNAICLDDGCYTMEVTGGSFPSEVGWTLNGANEGAMSGGANATVSFTVGSPVYGCIDPAAGNYDSLATCDDGSCNYSCLGDFDNNGVVNTGDLLLLMATFGCPSACGQYDLDGNGVVNTADLLLFMSVFGTICP